MNLINKWHTLLGMPQYDAAWHKQDMADELAEYLEASGFIETWSELSDVVYTYTRATWSGHTSIEFPLSKMLIPFGIIYMIPKYSLRWKFFRDLGHCFDTNLSISEVRNPKKIEKLRVIAEKYNLDPDLFTKKALELMERRVFLK